MKRILSIPVKRFTLIELLVVIAIIAILAGMLLPALNSAREKGRAISCMNNFSTLSKALLMYFGDYNEQYPCYWNSKKGYNGGLGRSAIGTGANNLFAPYIPVIEQKKQTLGFIPKGNKARHYMACPSRVGSATLDVFTIAINNHSFGKSDDDNMTSVKWTRKPALSYYMGESLMDESASTNNSQYIGLWSAFKVNFVHQGKTNMLFTDGHVASLSQTEVVNTSTYSNTLDQTLAWWHAARSVGDTTTNLTARKPKNN